MLNFVNDKWYNSVLSDMCAMNTYVNITQRTEEKNLRANCGKNTNKNALLHCKICTFTGLCSNEKNTLFRKFSGILFCF